MRTCAIVALVLALAPVAGCALAHERPAERADASLLVGDASQGRDAAAPDAAVVDAGPITSCTELWTGLPACPAVAVPGEPCLQPGVTCGMHCCESGPPMQCVGGVWEALDLEVVCPPGIDCAPSLPCGAGVCAPDRICLRSVGETRVADLCVLPPAPILSCAGAPPGSITTDPRTCQTCSCLDRSGVGGVVVSLECACCDTAAP